jgi:hypothetical protein
MFYPNTISSLTTTLWSVLSLTLETTMDNYFIEFDNPLVDDPLVDDTLVNNLLVDHALVNTLVVYDALVNIHDDDPILLVNDTLVDVLLMYDRIVGNQLIDAPHLVNALFNGMLVDDSSCQ